MIQTRKATPQRTNLPVGAYTAEYTKWDHATDGTYGKRLQLYFQLLGKQDQHGNPIIYGKKTYWATKNNKTQELESAVTKDREITKIFSAMGFDWKESISLNPDDYIGKNVLVIIDKFDDKETGERVSYIKNVMPLETDITEEKVQ